MDESRLLLEEFQRRQAVKAGTAEKKAAIAAELFPNQRRFYEDKSRWKAVLGSRRAGKTEMWARIATIKALEHPRALIRIWSVARLRAKELLWANFRYLHARHGIKVETNETELSITFENGAVIRLVGADKDKEVQKKRGDKTVFEVVLEAQNVGSILKTLVEDVIEPSLLDERGDICVEGTPGALCTGYWWDISGGEDTAATWTSKGSPSGSGAGWSCHRWTMLDNPFIPHAREELAAIKLKKRWADDNPTYLREWCGRWVNDLTALFYKFDLLRNTYDPKLIQPWGKGWNHVLGWDLGSRDDMAIVIWGWHPAYDSLFEVFSWKKPGALASEVMEEIDKAEQGMALRLIEQVADTQGGGKMYVEEVMSRYTRSFKPAKKGDKYQHVQLLNDDLLVGRIKLRPNSPLQLEMAALMRDPDWPDPEKPEVPPTEHPGCPNHCCFVAGTMIITDRGEVPIEQLRPGDRALTRGGFRHITQTGMTGVKPVVSKLGLTGTPDHPVWVKGEGWKRLDEVRSTDVVLYASWNNRESSSGAGTSGIATQTPSEGQIESITGAPSMGESRSGFIVQFGQRLMAKFRKSTTFTTSTRTRSTTTSRISSVSPAQNTLPCTGESTSRPTLRSTERAWKPLASLRLLGTVLLKAVRGIASTPGWWRRMLLCTDVAAWCVAAAFSPRRALRACAEEIATPERGARADWMMFFASAQLAERTSSSTNTRSNDPALAPVQAVYAISVDEIHEFFANSVLVSNCDAGLYSYRAAWHYFKPSEATVEPAQHEAQWVLEAQKRLTTRQAHGSWVDRLERGASFGFGADD